MSANLCVAAGKVSRTTTENYFVEGYPLKDFEVHIPHRELLDSARLEVMNIVNEATVNIVEGETGMSFSQPPPPSDKNDHEGNMVI